MNRYPFAELVPVVLADGWAGDMPRGEVVGAWAWCPCGGEYLECDRCRVVACAECCEYMWVCRVERVLVCSECAGECSCCGPGVPVSEAEAQSSPSSGLAL